MFLLSVRKEPLRNSVLFVGWWVVGGGPVAPLTQTCVAALSRLIMARTINVWVSKVWDPWGQRCSGGTIMFSSDSNTGLCIHQACNFVSKWSMNKYFLYKWYLWMCKYSQQCLTLLSGAEDREIKDRIRGSFSPSLPCPLPTSSLPQPRIQFSHLPGTVLRGWGYKDEIKYYLYLQWVCKNSFLEFHIWFAKNS